MKLNKHTKLTHTNATTHFENSWDDCFQDPLFSDQPIGHKPSKLLLQPSLNYWSTWHKGEFIASTFKSHITQFFTLCFCKNKNIVIYFLFIVGCSWRNPPHSSFYPPQTLPIFGWCPSRYPCKYNQPT